ncbi:glycoside hydrolase family 28 protein [Edaphobacter sp. 12200R-103]|jgi:polygalacturonase|uniref:glycoside hydrolase family 28 protein n=1 Tax=Edaphobacter sp. 12200R-103 TaxID=2703788 RepID=UPI00138CCE8D|nr:glycoside hydrolase family 28 protein [Edaphobacter sp. 12200R-103]QHS51935.1 glycoside hydrolase family 28 protein [Edaphobacter sp. 12200R-103]
MNLPIWERRTFLKHAGKSLGAASLLASVSGSGLQAQTTVKQGRRVANGTPVSHTSVHLNVKDFGAIGDGKTKDTLAVQQALDRCNVLGGGEVFVPAGDYLTAALVLRSNTTLRLDEQASLLGSPDLADYPLTQVRWEGHWIKGYNGYISAVDATNIAIVGKGKIIGNAAIKGRYNRQTGVRNPALLEFTNCKNIRVEDCYTAQNDMWSIHPVYCENITFRNMTVKGNADGIDVDSCRRVVIEGCDFATGDDCISLKSGRGMEGNTIGVPTEDVKISNCTFRDLHWACIGIGSETSAGIRNVRVDHCRCLSARTFAIYIKSRPGRGAFIEDIYMNDLEVEGAQAGFLRINILNSGLQDKAPVQGDEGIPTIRNFHFSNIRVKDMPMLVDAVSIHPHKPLDGFSLTNVTGTCKKGIELANMNRVVLKNIDVTGYEEPLLSTYHVTGTGLKGAVALPEPKPTAPVPELKEPYVLR